MSPASFFVTVKAKSFQNLKDELQAEVLELKEKMEKQQRFIARLVCWLYRLPRALDYFGALYSMCV